MRDIFAIGGFLAVIALIVIAVGVAFAQSGGTGANIGANNSTTPTFTHVLSGGPIPTIAAGTGAGTGPTLSIAGHDLAGQVTLTTGTTPAASATICTITWGTAFGTAPYIVISPANANADILSGVTQVYPTSTTTTGILTSGSTGLTASTQYIWNWIAIP